MEMSNKKSIAVVIISKDEASLNVTIELLKPQCEKLNASLIVVDASERRLDWIRREHPWVIWHDYVKPLDRNFTIPQQRNLGVRLSNADIIAYCDSGSIPDDNWLEELTNPIVKNQYRVTSGPITSSNPGIYSVVNDEPTGTPISTVLTANFAFERSAFDEAGGFNEEYDYGSDADFAFRLMDVGIPPTSVQTARMKMDWGLWELQKKRSWRYGRARARLLKYHPRRRAEILKSAVILFVYPPLVVIALYAIVQLFFLNFIPLLGLGALVGALLLRNRKIGSAPLVLYSNLIYTTAMIFEFFSQLVKPTKTILFLPEDRNPYQHRLKEELTNADVKVDFFSEPTKSASINLFLLPFRLVSMKLGGTKILHLHWTEEFVPHWLANTLGRSLAELWLRFFLKTLAILKIKLVYTVHNLLPHEKLFNNDERVVKLILRSSAAAVIHQKSTIKNVKRLCTTVPIYVIPEGIDALTSPIKKLKDKSISLVILGQIKRYKGIKELLEQLVESKEPLSNVNLKIAGTCNDSVLKADITDLVAQAQTRGWNIQLSFDYMTQEEMQKSFAESDAALFSFTRITNSGSVRMALGCGIPVIVPKLEVLGYLPSNVALKYKSAAVVEMLSQLSKNQLESMREASYGYAQQFSWKTNALAHLDMYREVLNAK